MLRAEDRIRPESKGLKEVLSSLNAAADRPWVNYCLQRLINKRISQLASSADIRGGYFEPIRFPGMKSTGFDD